MRIIACLVTIVTFCALLYGCNGKSSHSSPNYSDNTALCNQINQQLGTGSVKNTAYSSHTLNAADKALLLQQYNQYDCNAKLPEATSH